MASKDTFRPSATRLSDWQRAYQAALKEADTRKLFKLVEVAEAAVRTRQAELQENLDHHSERQALRKAVTTLLVVKRNRLKYRQQYFPD
jgi:hypothetical protein